jgi:hypothetical protein
MVPHGTQTAAACIADCKCVPVNNCGQWNGTGIISCGKNITALNVCPACNLPYLTPGPSMQNVCDLCVATPAPEGCGPPAPAPQLYKCTNNACVAGDTGVPLVTCKASCGPGVASRMPQRATTQ